MTAPPPAPPLPEPPHYRHPLEQFLDDEDPFAEKRFQKELQFKLVKAVETGNIELLRPLIEAGVDTNAVISFVKTPLTLAVEQEELNVDITLLLLQAGADPNNSEKAPRKALPIHIASSRGRCDIIRLLLAYGADVNGRDNGGNVAIHFAARNGYDEALNVLLENGADISLRDNVGRTALNRAIEKRHFRVAETLIDAGASVNCCDDFGWTPIVYTIMMNDTATLKMLLSNGALIDVKNRNLDTPLHVACSRMRKCNGDVMLRTAFDYYKRSRRIPTRDFKHILQHQRHADFEVIWLLLNTGAPVNAKNSALESPIHLLVQDDIVRYLVLAGAVINLDMLMSDLPEEDIIRITGRTPALHKWLTSQYVEQFTLKRLARNCIRQQLSCTRDVSGAITELPLPNQLKAFLNLSDFEHI